MVRSYQQILSQRLSTQYEAGEPALRFCVFNHSIAMQLFLKSTNPNQVSFFRVVSVGKDRFLFITVIYPYLGLVSFLMYTQ